jgi:hypothetical protein
MLQREDVPDAMQIEPTGPCSKASHSVSASASLRRQFYHSQFLSGAPQCSSLRPKRFAARPSAPCQNRNPGDADYVGDSAVVQAIGRKDDRGARCIGPRDFATPHSRLSARFDLAENDLHCIRARHRRLQIIQSQRDRILIRYKCQEMSEAGYLTRLSLSESSFGTGRDAATYEEERLTGS